MHYPKVSSASAEAIERERWLSGSKEYCSIVTLDMRNAFNSADWAQKQRALIRMQTPQYLTRIVANAVASAVLSLEQNEYKWRCALKNSALIGYECQCMLARMCVCVCFTVTSNRFISQKRLKRLNTHISLLIFGRAAT